MLNPDNIQDWSILDNFISKNLEDYKKTVLGKYDEQTGYYEDLSPDNDVETADDNTAPPQQDQSNLYDNMSQSIIGDQGSQEQQMQSQLSDQFMNDLWSDGTGDGNAFPVSGNYSYGNYNPPSTSSSGSIAERHNNPGNLKFATWMSKFGAVPGDKGKDGGRFAKFPDISSGLQARVELLKKPMYANKSVDTAMLIYSNNGYDGSIYPEIRKKKIGDLTDEQLAELTKRQLQHEDVKYARKLGFQTGGSIPIARSKQEQYVGLNNENIDQLILPLQGTNTIRGLDSGKPLLIKDKNGKNYILNNVYDTLNIDGPVYEHRIR